MPFETITATGRDILDLMMNTHTYSASSITIQSPKVKGLCVDGATIKNVIFNDPATIVFWSDDDKTIVKCQKGDTYNPELGLAMCIVKKCCKNKGNFNDVFKKWIPNYGK